MAQGARDGGEAAPRREPLPGHLRRHVVEQGYRAYTPRDQAVWRHVLRRLVRALAGRAHPAYLRGLQQVRIGTERIPRVEELDAGLAPLGWSAVCVRGFLPPAVFTELQSRGVLAVAADIRSAAHVAYTPAPDVIHESAGHAPILADPDYAAFLRRAGELGFRAIPSLEDGAVHEAVRALSEAKEDPGAGARRIEAAEEALASALASRGPPSEAARASRLYWWTAEYGLVGSLDAPLLYGAGLLSSLGEGVHALSEEVLRLPLSPACVEADYDITRMQPRLFVARDLAEPAEVAEAFAATLSFRRGGDHGLRVARAARTPCALALPDGHELSGVVRELLPGPRPAGPGLATAAAVVGPPCLLSRGGRALGSPWSLPGVVAFGGGRLPREGRFALDTGTGLELEGRVVRGPEVAELRGRTGSRELPLPPRALLLLAPSLPSVSGGAADAGAWDGWFGAPTPGPEAGRAALDRRSAGLSPRLAALYAEVRALRERGTPPAGRLELLAEELRAFPGEWLLREELRELGADVAGEGGGLAAT